MPERFKLTTKQVAALKLFSLPSIYTLLYGGSRSTKTFTIIRTIVIRALAAPGSRHVVTRFRFNHVKASIVYDTFPKVMELCFPGCPFKLDKTDWFVEYPNGSQIWFGGLDDKERTEKILGNEYATIFLNETSQISYDGYLMMVTRLAQKCTYKDSHGDENQLRLKMFIDENPPDKGHWTYRLFIQHKDPLSRSNIKKPENYSNLLMNPMDNVANLPEEYIDQLDSLPKRKRDRFLLGKFGDINDKALWNSEIITASRVSEAPQMVRVVVAVDPSGASDDETKSNDEIGIAVAGLGVDGVGYMLEDLTIGAGPGTWGKVVGSAYERHKADRVVGEANYGGAMVEFVVKAASPNISYKAVTATRGKVVRAEPIAALHETGKIKMVGNFDDLEDELESFTTTGYTGMRSPNRADAFIWAFTELFPGIAAEQVESVELNFMSEF